MRDDEILLFFAVTIATAIGIRITWLLYLKFAEWGRRFWGLIEQIERNTRQR